MIKIIVRNVYSNPDIYGNRYWRSYVYSTKNILTSTIFKVDHSGNMQQLLVDAGFKRSEIYDYDIGVPIREFNKYHNTFRAAFTAQEIIAAIKETFL